MAQYPYQQYTPQPYWYQNQPTPPAQQPNSSIVWIQGGLNAAKNYHVAPNESIPLWDQEEQVIYLKSADASGMPTIKILDYTIRESQPLIQNEANFATKDDLAEIKAEIAKLTESLNYRSKQRKEYQRNE